MEVWRGLTVALLLTANTFSLAQSNEARPTPRPDFTGTWKLNLQRSGPRMPRGLEALTQIIHHQDPRITVRETRVVSGKTTSSKDSTEMIDSVEHVWHS